MRLEQLLFIYVIVATLLMALAWAITDGPWTQGDTFIGIAVLMVMLILGWQQKQGD